MSLSLDPRTKVLFFSSMLALAFICRDIWAMIALVAASLAASLVEDDKTMIKKGLKTMLPLLAVAFILWSFMHEWSLFQNYGSGVDFQLGAFMTLRLFLILLVSLNFVSAVKPGELVKALDSFRLPYRAVFILGLTLRHIYTIADDYRAIKEAQASRGLELDKGSLITRIRNYVPVLIPLFVRSIENAEKLTLAMELKSFTFKRRRYFRGRLRAIDVAVIAALIITLALSIMHYWLAVI